MTLTANQRGGLATYLAGNQPLGQTYELSQVTFHSGSAELGAAANDEIADTAGALQPRSTARVSLRGYADPAGDAAANRENRTAGWLAALLRRLPGLLLRLVFRNELVELGNALAFGGAHRQSLEPASRPQRLAFGFQLPSVEIGHQSCSRPAAPM